MFKHGCTVLTFLLFVNILSSWADSEVHNYEDLKLKAEALRDSPFYPSKKSQKDNEQWSYDQYRDISFDEQKRIPLGDQAAFRMDLLPSGYIYKDSIDIYIVDNDLTTVPNRGDWFLNRRTSQPFVTKGISGFKILYPLNQLDKWDEVIVFQGASYFRALPQYAQYGLSARAVAIPPQQGRKEEFPHFKSFWILAPNKSETFLTILALLDSPSLTGAFEFVVHPGRDTVIEVKASLYPRTGSLSLGIAPLTSMFLYDETNRSRFNDYRNEVHDSDNLWLRTSSDQDILRPLINPKTIQYSSFTDTPPKDFGLLQRKRKVSDYQDWEAHYEARPNLWIQPRGLWPSGTLDLIEIPTDREGMDNIVAFWKVPEINKHLPFEFNYNMYWTLNSPSSTIFKYRVMSTHIGEGTTPGSHTFVVDYEYEKDVVPSDNICSKVSSGPTKVAAFLQHNKELKLLRATFELPSTSEERDLKLALYENNKIVSEIWTYRLEK
ncbi:glucan biosynthesis protein [Spirochaeta cellobiosiphila]|uniref:glucan biosynthesis protein n=1 Tax=Spirochaeta cellobiosiphila TaxID=504483 RepID=UPI0003F686B0|nr:glucan biosynthesis protein [Spirochaeta cellobiosiphila]